MAAVSDGKSIFNRVCASALLLWNQRHFQPRKTSVGRDYLASGVKVRVHGEMVLQVFLLAPQQRQKFAFPLLKMGPTFWNNRS